MASGERKEIIYSIWDPTGNITALVESPTEVERQPQVAAALMERHPEVEQVGFVKAWKKDAASLPAGTAGGQSDGAGDGGRSDRAGVGARDGGLSDSRIDAELRMAGGRGSNKIDAELRMAGGEFCGNASLCTAAWYLSRENDSSFDGQACAATILEAFGGLPAKQPKIVTLKVSGADEPVEVRLKKIAGDSETTGGFEGEVLMPRARGISVRPFEYRHLSGSLPIVEMEGISHMIIEPESVFASLVNDQAAAEEAVRLWCAELGADGLGLMFLGDGRKKARGSVKAVVDAFGSSVKGAAGTGVPGFSGIGAAGTGVTCCRLIPLVYIPGSGTVFWESSCASGTAAAGMYLTDRTDGNIDLGFEEPGGFLRVRSDPAGHKTCLCGRVRLLLRGSLKL